MSIEEKAFSRKRFVATSMISFGFEKTEGGYRFEGDFMNGDFSAILTVSDSGNAANITIDDRIREINFGSLEGKSLSEMGDDGFKFYMDPFHFSGFPNGEKIRDVCERTQSFLKELIARDDGKTYLISTHGCAMRAMVNYLKDDPSDYWYGHAPYNCSFTIVEAQGGKARITDVDKVYYDSSLIVDHFKK